MWRLILMLLLTTLLLIFIYLRNIYNYWHKRGVDTPPYHYVVGNLWEQFIFRKNFGVIVTELYNNFKGYNYFGIYSSTQPAIVIRNPEIVADVLIKDFSFFGDNDFHVDEKVDLIMARNPFILKGKKWKSVRSLVSPSFTTGKVKVMLPLMHETSKKLLSYLQQNENVAIDAKLLSMRITSENIASCAFGLDGASFTENSEFLQMSTNMSSPILSNLIFLVPYVGHLVNLRFFLQTTTDFLRSIVMQTINYRKENNVKRNDFLNTMSELRERINNEEQFGIDDVLAHAGGFFLDGIETSATAISHALYELATHEEIQTKLRKEIKETLEKYQGQLSYEAIQEMEYVECVFKESLRCHAPLFFFMKRVTKPYTMRTMREDGTGPKITLETGTQVVIPVNALHFDEDFFPKGKTFIPERFSSENKDLIVKNTYLPFGDGPRVCLGMKFGALQIKVALIAIISNYQVSVNEKTQQPPRIDPKNFFNNPVGGYWLEFNKL